MTFWHFQIWHQQTFSSIFTDVKFYVLWSKHILFEFQNAKNRLGMMSWIWSKWGGVKSMPGLRPFDIKPGSKEIVKRFLSLRHAWLKPWVGDGPATDILPTITLPFCNVWVKRGQIEVVIKSGGVQRYYRETVREVIAILPRTSCVVTEIYPFVLFISWRRSAEVPRSGCNSSVFLC